VYDWLHRRPLLLDVPLACGLALLSLAGLGTGGGYWWSLLMALASLTLVVRRSRPALAFGVVSIAMAGRAAAHDNLLPGDVVFLVAIYSLAANEPRRPVRLAGLAVAALGSAIAALRFTSVNGATPGTGVVVFTFIACAGSALSAWTLGDLKRARLQRLADLQDRAERIEREREQELQLAAQQERASIAREMHDVIAHALSVIVVQADGAAYAAERSPDGALARSVDALQTIGSTARDALGETRRLVGVLRDPEAGVELAPTGGLDRLVDDLVARVRSAGVPVALSVHLPESASRPASEPPGAQPGTGPDAQPGTGPDALLGTGPGIEPGTGPGDEPGIEPGTEPGIEPGAEPVTEPARPTGLDLAAYRVVQESLTNVIKHAGPGASATVVVAQHDHRLRISVCDNGIGARSVDDGRGHGLHGMRERVAVHGGTLTAGPRPGGGFEVVATLPTREPA
jgi:signal transduction histidine kinase